MSQPLIDELVDELEPARRPLSIAASLAIWGVASWAIVSLLVLWSGPLRPGALEQLGASPRFALECGLGVALGLVAMAGALRSATPGRGRAAQLALPALLLLGAWVGAGLLGLASPAIAPAGLGHREHCLQQVLMMSAAPLLLGLFLLRQRAALAPGPSAGLAALAAASLPALAMQLACMYEPLHALQLHLSPMLVLGGVGLLLGRAFLQKI